MRVSQREQEARLRRDAENRIKSGTAPPVPDDWTVAPDALTQLYRLASSAGGAADALKLLQELQVHQVELGLQHEQMAATEREMADMLAECRNLYEWAPLGYVVAARDGSILDINRAGIALLGVSRDAAIGRAFDCFLSTKSRTTMRELFSALRTVGDHANCEIHFNQTGITGRIDASIPPDGEIALMIVSQQQGPRAV